MYTYWTIRCTKRKHILTRLGLTHTEMYTYYEYWAIPSESTYSSVWHIKEEGGRGSNYPG